MISVWLCGSHHLPYFSGKQTEEYQLSLRETSVLRNATVYHLLRALSVIPAYSPKEIYADNKTTEDFIAFAHR